MSKYRTDGRMIKKDISNSKKFASLSEKAAVLFAMLIPHYNSHGKMNGGPGYIKDEVCPYISYLTYENIPELLREISEKTNVKWFEYDGRHWIHSIKFLTDHQKLDMNKVGQDLLPTYSRVSRKEGGHEVEVEVEVEVEDKGSKSETQELVASDKITLPVKINSDTTLPPLTQASWDKFKEIYPKPRGIIEGEDAALRIFVATPAEWPRWIRNAGHYAGTERAKNGFVMNLDKWLSGSYRDYDKPEIKQAVGGNGKDGHQREPREPPPAATGALAKQRAEEAAIELERRQTVSA